MHCIELLHEHLNNCEDCRKNAFIIEYEELPENEKPNFSEYIREHDYILHCPKCEKYMWLAGTVGRVKCETKNKEYVL